MFSVFQAWKGTVRKSHMMSFPFLWIYSFTQMTWYTSPLYSTFTPNKTCPTSVVFNGFDPDIFWKLWKRQGRHPIWLLLALMMVAIDLGFKPMLCNTAGQFVQLSGASHPISPTAFIGNTQKFMSAKSALLFYPQNMHNVCHTLVTKVIMAWKVRDPPEFTFVRMLWFASWSQI